MKIGEWDSLGSVRGVIQRQLRELQAAEYAAHDTHNPENGRLRILVATDIGLIEYFFGPAGVEVEGPWLLRGEVLRWPRVKGLRLQTDAQVVEQGESREVWRLVADEPKMELSADTDGVDERQLAAVLPFARACIEHAT
jgi:hypothetical protein